MASKDRSITHHFQQIVRCLLHDIAPPDGAMALLLRRGLGPDSVFFPIGIAPQSFDRSGEVLKNYFLYSMHWKTEADDTETILDENSGMETLIQQGKLALALFDQGPVTIQMHACDSYNSAGQRELVLCSLRRPSPDAWKPPSLSIRRVFSEVVAVWRQLSASNLRIDEADHAVVADELAKILSDHLAEPPYFPTMHVKIDSRKGSKGTLVSGSWKANALSYNCFLMDNRQELAEEYIRDMFLARKIADIDRNVQSNDPLVVAIVSVCDDFIQQIGIHESSGTTIYARRNIEKSSYVGDPAYDTEVSHALDRNPSLWSLLKGSLRYLLGTHPDSALVTLWAGRINGANDVSALPMGFMPGARVELLAEAAQHAGLQQSQRIYTATSKNKRLQITAILPACPAANPLEHHNVVELLIKPVLDQADYVVRGAAIEARYPGPYVLDFQNDETKDCLIKTSDDNVVASVRCVQGVTDSEKLTYLLLLHLARATHHYMSHDQLHKWPDGGGKTSAKIAEAVVKVLAKLDLDPEQLIKNRHASGWELVVPSGDLRRVPRLESVGSAKPRRAEAGASMPDIDPKSVSNGSISPIEGEDELKNNPAWNNLTDIERSVALYVVRQSDESPEAFCRRMRLTESQYEDAREKATNKLRQGADLAPRRRGIEE